MKHIIIKSLIRMVNESLDNILARLSKLAQQNGTQKLVSDLEVYIRKYSNQFVEDYKNTSHRKRYSTGKLEGELFLKLAGICNFRNCNDNAKEASEIFSLLGYESYKQKPHRFRQKIENYKKKQKLKKSSVRSRKSAKRKIVKEESSDELPSDNEESSTPSLSSDSESVSVCPKEKSVPEVQGVKKVGDDLEISINSEISFPWDQELDPINDLVPSIAITRDLWDPAYFLVDEATTRSDSESNNESNYDDLMNQDYILAYQQQCVEEHKIAFATIFNKANAYSDNFSDTTSVDMFNLW